MTAPFCAAVDWGTTSFRIWLLDRAGTVLASRRSHEGMSHCAPDRFADTLENHLAALGAAPDLPVMACGMAGARQGWVEAPYIDRPARLTMAVDNSVAVPGSARRVRIMPGIAQRDPRAPDVMRGEETQLLGALGEARGRITACLPGSHCKWVEVADGVVTGFATYMTGELYAAIAGHTILARSFGEGEPVFDADAFDAGVDLGLHAPAMPIAGLFALRAGGLLGYIEPSTAAARLSGLLIGSEIAAVQRATPIETPVRLIASGQLADRYGRALERAGLDIRITGADEAVIAGLWRAAQRVFGDHRPASSVER